MSSLQKRYTDSFYIEQESPGKRKLVKKPYMNRRTFIELFPNAVLPGANGVFQCRHEQRDFIPKKCRKKNHTHVRMKRKHKARMKARKCA